MKTSKIREIKIYPSFSNSIGRFSIACFLFVILSTFLACENGTEEILTKETDEFLSAKSFDLDIELTNAQQTAGNIKFTFPEDNPGAPFYARVGPLLDQYFVKDGWLVIPFYRSPACINPEFNLMEVFDVPGAFFCELKATGFGITEADAPEGTFPIIVHTFSADLPFWFIPWNDFQVIAEDGVVTIMDIEALNPLKGKADKFKEILRPRMENHHVQINASGHLEDGRKFAFHVTHIGDRTKSIGLRIR